jgi:hypothetical protein
LWGPVTSSELLDTFFFGGGATAISQLGAVFCFLTEAGDDLTKLIVTYSAVTVPTFAVEESYYRDIYKGAQLLKNRSNVINIHVLSLRVLLALESRTVR